MNGMLCYTEVDFGSLGARPWLEAEDAPPPSLPRSAMPERPGRSRAGQKKGTYRPKKMERPKIEADALRAE